eukprot:4745063-Amphidinium_carterae.2
MIADCMTKTLSKCHTTPMQQLMCSGVWQLHPEWLELEGRERESRARSSFSTETTHGGDLRRFLLGGL